MNQPLQIIFIAFIALSSATLRAQATTTNSETDKNFPLIDKLPDSTETDAQLISFIQSQLVYPQKEKDLKVEGVVLVRFEILEDGTIGEVNVNQGVSPALDAEAIRVTKLLPKFIPARQNGMAVKSYKVLPVPFRL